MLCFNLLSVFDVSCCCMHLSDSKHMDCFCISMGICKTVCKKPLLADRESTDSIARGMAPAATPIPTLGHPFAPKTRIDSKDLQVKVQASRSAVFSLEGLALRSQLAASFQRPKWPPPYIYLGAPLGLANLSLKFIAN